MKKFILPLLLILTVGMLAAVESEPSEVVGYVKYDMLVGNNLIAIPMECPWQWASELGNSFSGSVDQISYWVAANQYFVTATNLGDFWDCDFAVNIAMPLMSYSYSAFTWPSSPPAKSHLAPRASK